MIREVKRVSGTNLDQLLKSAQHGDDNSRNTLIEAYRPFILKASAQVSGRYIHYGEDDEASIAMMAFDEAIDSFDATKGVSFLSFAKQVIRRRLIDYFRKQSRNTSIPISSLNNDGQQGMLRIEANKAQEQYLESQETKEKREEIAVFQQNLGAFGINFSDLVKSSPKHETARRRAMEVASLIVKTQYLRDYFFQKKVLPLKELSMVTSVSRKTLERQRKYIIAIVLILDSDYRYLQEYIKKVL